MKIFGVLVVAGMAVLTSVTSQYVINAANKDADIAYKQALETFQTNNVKNELEESSEIKEDISRPVEEDPKPQESDVSDINTEVSSKPEEKPEKPVKPDKQNSTPEKPNKPVKEFSENIKRMKFDNCTLVDGKLVYTVQDGDYLSLIAERFGCTVSQIDSVNKIANVDLIYTGDKFVIPVTSDVLAYAKTVIH